MRHIRRLSRQEQLWVEEIICQLCTCHGVSVRDEEYRSIAWAAFFTAFRQFRPLSSPDFWPYVYGQIGSAILAEKQLRQDRVYRLLSLDVPAAPDSDETFLNRLPTHHGDFTNGVLLWDFLSRLPEKQFHLAIRLAGGDDLEESRSTLGMTEQELCQTVDDLRRALLLYTAI